MSCIVLYLSIEKLAKNNDFYGIFLYKKVKVYNKNDIIDM